MVKVVFATKCWEKDWKQMLAGGFDRKVEACNYPFGVYQKRIIINNGVPPVDWFAIGATPIFAVANAQKLLDFFQLPSLNVYATGELAAIWSSPEDSYLCYVQGDCITQGDWIEKGIKILEENPDVSVVSPASEVNTWHDPVTKRDHYMSDQAWLVRVEEFRNPEVYQYSLKMPQDPDYPDYGGNSFEHMVGQYLKATGKYRYIVEDAWVNHPAY